MNLSVTPGPDDVVQIGPEPLGATYVAEVELPGVTVLFDPTSPTPAAHARVYDVTDAQAVVELLFGPAVANAVMDGTPATVPTELSAEVVEVERLGWLTWLDRYRPIPLDDRLLGLERAIAHAELPDHEYEIDEPDNVAAVAALARHVRENPGLPLAGQLRGLVRTGLLHLPVFDSEQPLVTHERDLLQIDDQWGGAALTSGDLAWLADQLTPTPAGHLGGESVLAGRASLDWRRVPRTLLPAAENTVSFEVTAGRVTIAIEPPLPTARHPALPALDQPSAQMVASLRSSTWPLPLAEGPIEFDPVEGSWRADFPIVPAAVELARQADVLDVDVRSRRLAWLAPNQSRARESAARRWAARGVTAQRLSTLHEDNQLREAGTAALRYSARLWSAAGHRDRAERCLALARGPWPGTRLSLAEEWLLASGGGAPSWAPSVGD